MYCQITKSIRVSVKTTFLEKQSLPRESYFVWAYQIKIENLGNAKVQLLNRKWSITDADGRTQIVKGPGVVGEQPFIQPGGTFEYTSGTPLKTPSGLMVGVYEMAASQGIGFDVNVPAFSLDSPHQTVKLN